MLTIITIDWCTLIVGRHKARPLQLLMQSLFTINCNDYPIRVCGILDVRAHKKRQGTSLTAVFLAMS